MLHATITVMRDGRDFEIDTREVKAFILMAVVIEFPLFIWMFYTGLPDLELARTRMFFMFIILELVIALNFRSMRYGLFKAPPHM